MFQSFSNFWENTKAWFKHSETILVARMTAFTGFVLASLAALDWSPMLSLAADAGMSLKAGLTLGGAMFAHGIVTEWARRRNTVEVDSKLIPTDIVKEVKTEVVTNPPATVVSTTTQTVEH